jgi:hypothetical protein
VTDQAARKKSPARPPGFFIATIRGGAATPWLRRVLGTCVSNFN